MFRPLRVAIFSTGDELREPGEPTPPGAVYDANRYVLRALLEQLGCEVSDLGILRDRLDAIRDALAGAAGSCDAIVTSGGMSTGDEDHVRAAVVGARLDPFLAPRHPARAAGRARPGEAAFRSSACRATRWR